MMSNFWFFLVRFISHDQQHSGFSL
jgi:hypothetical protein